VISPICVLCITDPSVGCLENSWVGGGFNPPPRQLKHQDTELCANYRIVSGTVKAPMLAVKKRHARYVTLRYTVVGTAATLNTTV